MLDVISVNQQNVNTSCFFVCWHKKIRGVLYDHLRWVCGQARRHSNGCASNNSRTVVSTETKKWNVEGPWARDDPILLRS